MIRVFDVDNRQVKINDSCLLVPELKAIIDFYPEDPIPALAYVYFMTAPDSPYANLPEQDKQQVISEDVQGEFTFEDDVIVQALEKMKKLYQTPTARLYEAVRNSLDRLSVYLENTAIVAGRDGNLEAIDRIQSNVGKKIEAFKKLEKIRDEEVKTALRGKAQLGMY